MPPFGLDEYQDETFSATVVRQAELHEVRFDGCRFEECDLAETRLRACRFVECVFDDCDLGMVDVTDSAFIDVRFERCTLVGVNWALAANSLTEPLGLDFDGCALKFSSFVGVDLKKRALRDCLLHEAIFQETVLAQADCRGSSFHGALFVNCDLRESDFRGASDYLIDVRTNRVEGARFTLPEAIGLLHGLGIDLG